MTTLNTTKTADASPARGWLHVVRYYLGNRWLSLIARKAHVLEVGSWESRSAIFFLNYLPQTMGFDRESAD